MGKLWKKGRGKLGILQPLLGRWAAEADSEMGPVRCTRVFEPVLGGAYIQLTALWEFGRSAAQPKNESTATAAGSGRRYEEVALLGVGSEGQVCFWSFTSDGKHSEGIVADATDLHAEAIGFEADMPAGRARMAYWPAEDGGFFWVVESKTKKRWRRFVEHHYRAA